MAKKKFHPDKKPNQKPTWELAKERIEDGPLSGVLDCACVTDDEHYPMAKDDWAYVTSDGWVYLNTSRSATVGEWEYVISHCLLHLGLGHFREEKLRDIRWNAACDFVVAKFLKDSHIGTLPSEFQSSFPFEVKTEAQVYRLLCESGDSEWNQLFSTMARGRPDMGWDRENIERIEEYFAESLQEYLNKMMQDAAVSVGMTSAAANTVYHRARTWFISSYPLLGALAASFRIIDDETTVRRMDISVAAVSAQMQEIYINPRCRLGFEEWKFILAHEFLHAALRHDLRYEDRDPELWNVACDFVVNGWLVEMNVGVMPEFGLFSPQFKGMSVEVVYDVICEDIRHYRNQNPRDVLFGDPAWWDSLDGSERDAYYRSALQQGLTYHQERGRGFLPAGLVEEIRAVSRPPIPWDVELAKWFDEHFTPIEKRRTYARMSRRQSSTPDIPRPAWHQAEETVEHRIFGVLLDTSGSMDRSLLAAALGSIASYSQARDVKNVRVVFCDAVAYDQGIMRPDEIAGSVKVRGRGGTKLQPGIDLLDNDPKFPKNAPLLIITDGACDRLNLRGRNHAYLIPWGYRLPFVSKGPVFRLK